MKDYVIIALAACLIGFLIVVLRNTRSMKKLALGSLGGLAAFGAVNLSSLITGIGLAPNLGNIGIAIILGLPGVVSVMFLKLLWGI